ncbi:DUF6332 family protein [Streptomyces sp. WM6378]|uniref:DUF6332 family protein n=1 Tax=Streptomyces sp. WM6378 TaxID=1415557 RepID=UPI0006ADC81C|nr:DUF6332 family protein [Streptomyces sp. WM6378]KOU38059.1 hypothetical protein ADK54_30115 [Streptomyces sp. WM6378]
MTNTRTRRTQAERDAMTIETVSALFSSTLYAGATFLLVMLPVLYGLVSGAAKSGLVAAAGAAAAVAFVARMVEALWRFGQRAPETD